MSRARLPTSDSKSFVNLGSVGWNGDAQGRLQKGTGGPKETKREVGRVDVGADRTTGELGRTKRNYEGRAEKMAGCVGG